MISEICSRQFACFYRLNFKISVSVLLLLVVACSQSEVMAGNNVRQGESVGAMSGFVNAAFVDNLTKKESYFSLSEVEIDIIKVLPRRAALRLDLNFKDRSSDLITSEEGGELTLGDLVEQGYVSVVDGDHTFLLGKFNAPIGLESHDAPDRYQISHSMIFDVGRPTSLTGLWLLSDFGTMDFSFYLANGWGDVTRDRKSRTYGGRAGFVPADFFNFGISYLYGDAIGKGQWKTPEKLSVWDFDMKIRSGASIMGFEYTRGVHEKNGLINPGFGDARWYGYLFMAYFELAPGSGISFMYEVFADDDGVRLPASLKEKREALTISPSLTLPGGPVLRLEFRMVTSNKNVFKIEDNLLRNRERLLGVEVFYSF